MIGVSGFDIIEINQISSNPKRLKTKLHRTLAQLARMGYLSKIEAIIGAK